MTLQHSQTAAASRTRPLESGSQLLFRPMLANPQDAALFRACFDRNGSPRELERIAWQYVANPTGRLWVDFAVDPAADGRVAGIYAVMPIWMKVGDTRLLAAQSVDTLTDQEYRGRGLFVKMAQSVYARCAEGGASLVYGFPNENSAHGFFTKLGWHSLDPIPFLVRPLRSRYVIGKAARGVQRFVPDLPIPVFGGRIANGERMEPLARFDRECAELWRRFSKDIHFAVDRDAQYLNWRFREKPGVSYEILALRRAALEGFVVFTVADKHGGRIGYVMEMLHDPRRPEIGRKLLSAALKSIAARGADAVLAWNFAHSPNHRSYLSMGFIPLPKRLRPVELHIGVRALAVTNRADIADRTEWYISYADSDTV